MQISEYSETETFLLLNKYLVRNVLLNGVKEGRGN